MIHIENWLIILGLGVALNLLAIVGACVVGYVMRELTGRAQGRRQALMYRGTARLR